MDFSEKIRELRKEKGITQEEASKQMNIGISSLRNYEKNRLPETFQLKIIKEFYDVPYEYLLNDKCFNKDIKNLEIGKELKISDNTIEQIKKLFVSSHNNNSSIELNAIFDMFISNISLENFMSNIKAVIITNRQYKKNSKNFLELKKLVNEYKESEFKKSKKTNELIKKINLIIEDVEQEPEEDGLFFDQITLGTNFLRNIWVEIQDFVEDNDTEQIKERMEALLGLIDEIIKKMKIFVRYSSYLVTNDMLKFLNKIIGKEGEQCQ